MGIESILKKEFPELRVEISSMPATSDIQQEELSKAITYVRENELVQDSQRLLSEPQLMRESVTYPIIFPDQERKLFFEVKWVQGPMKYIGFIQTRTPSGQDELLARLYGMYLRD